MTTDVILGLVRHVLTFGGGFLVTAGYLDQGNMETGIGALVALVGVVWSVFHKVQVAKA